MDDMGIYLDNLSNLIHHPKSGRCIPVIRKFGNSFVTWNPFRECFFSELQLRRLHRRFGHPSTEKLLNLPRRSRTKDLDEGTRKKLSDIERKCKPCQQFSRRPGRFRFSIQSDKFFNHTIFADIFYIDRKTVLHVVDE